MLAVLDLSTRCQSRSFLIHERFVIMDATATRLSYRFETCCWINHI